MKDLKNPVLYSTMTMLAYNVNKRFYRDLHYFWCTPYFGSDFSSPHFTTPPSSSPLEIYKLLQKEVDGADKHGSKIKLNRMGIRRGADIMLKRRLISEEKNREIHAVCGTAPLQYFKPLLCIIPRLAALKFFKEVPVKERASPLSYEYIVADVPQSAFDVIRIG